MSPNTDLAYFDQNLLSAVFLNDPVKEHRQMIKRMFYWQEFQIAELNQFADAYIGHDYNNYTIKSLLNAKANIYDCWNRNKRYLWKWGFTKFIREVEIHYWHDLWRAWKDFHFCFDIECRTILNIKKES